MMILMTKVTLGMLSDNHNIIPTRKSLAAENAFMSKVWWNIYSRPATAKQSFGKKMDSSFLQVEWPKANRKSSVKSYKYLRKRFSTERF